MDTQEGLHSALDRTGRLAHSQRLALGSLQKELSELGLLLKERAASASSDRPLAAAEGPRSSSYDLFPMLLAAVFAALLPVALLGTWSLAGGAGAGARRAAAQPRWPGDSRPKTEKLAQLMTISDDLSRTVLKLVYAHRLAGRKETVLEQIGARSEAFLDLSSWAVERLGRDAFLVAYRPRGAGLEQADGAYEFEADLLAGTVTPSPKTEERLLAAVPSDASPRGR